MRKREMLLDVSILLAIVAIVFSLAVLGCGSPPKAPDATPAQLTRAARLSAVTEARQAYSLALDTAVQLHHAKLISDATFNAADDYALSARKLLDAADAALVAGDDAAVVSDLDSAWLQIDQAVATHSPAATKPSLSRK